MFILILFFIQAGQAEVNQCLRLLSQMKLAVQINPLIMYMGSLPYLQFSGLGIQEMGLYDQCLRANHTYSTLQFEKYGTHLYLYQGVCHSSLCTSQDLNDSRCQTIIRWLIDQTGIPKTIGFNISETTLNFIDPQNANPSFEFGTYATIISIIILALLCSYYPIVHLIENFENRKIRYKKAYGLNIQGQDSHLEFEEKQIVNKQKNNFLQDFNLIPNYHALTSMKTPDPNLAIFNGFRTIAFLMVVYGHTYEISMSISYIMEVQQLQNGKSWLVMWIFNMLYSVDIFFWIGGFFLGFITCEIKKIRQIGSKPLSILFLITHRLWRILPSYFMAMLLSNYIVPYLGDGPRWPMAIYAMQWKYFPVKQLLFIDNLSHDGQGFFGWGWYLTSDFQLFVSCLFPILIYALGFKRTAKVVIVLLIIGTSIVGLVLSIQKEYLIPYYALMAQNNGYYYYQKPWCRGPPYYFGLLLGIWYREMKTDLAEKKDTTLTRIRNYCNKNRLLTQIIFYTLGWGIILSLLLAWRVVYVSDDRYYWPKMFQEIYNTFCRLLFVMGCSCFLFVNMVGIHDFFNTSIMSCKLFRFIAKISFTCYLVHILVMIYPDAAFYQTPNLTQLNYTQVFVGTVTLTVFFGFLMSLMIELPFGKLETRLMSKLTRPKKQQELLLEK